MSPLLIALGLVLCPSLVAAPTTAPAPTEIIPKFSFVAHGWLSAPQVMVMDAYWANMNLTERGTNYWLTGGPKCDTCRKWERFNPESDLFQSLMGVFVLKDFEFVDEWAKPSPAKVKKSASRVMEIAAASQSVWLKNQGLAAPKAELVPGSIVITTWSDGYLRVLGKISTQCDLGEENPKRPSLPRFNDKLKEKLESFQPMELTYQALVKYLPDTKNLVVVYTALPTLTKKNGQLHTASPKVLWDLERMATAVTF